MTNFSYTFPTDEVDPTPGKMKFINWIRCADRMPPDDDRIIVNDLTKYLDILGIELWVQKELYGDPHDYEWIPFDEATWQELNNDV